MTPKQFLKIQDECLDQIERAENRIEKAREKVVIPPLEKLRPMTSKDLVEGSVVFHCYEENPTEVVPDHWFWHIIDEVLYHQGDDFKAYIADGRRYGLKLAWVLK